MMYFINVYKYFALEGFAFLFPINNIDDSIRLEK